MKGGGAVSGSERRIRRSGCSRPLGVCVVALVVVLLVVLAVVLVVALAIVLDVALVVILAAVFCTSSISVRKIARSERPLCSM